MAHRIQIAATLPVGMQGLELPNNLNVPAGSTLTLSDEDFSLLNPNLFSTGLVTDLGVTGVAGQQVTTQGSAVVLTSSQLATTLAAIAAPAAYTQADAQEVVTLANDLLTAYNQLQADVVALQTQLSGAGRALA